jgi:hypothetical protein
MKFACPAPFFVFSFAAALADEIGCVKSVSVARPLWRQRFLTGLRLMLARQSFSSARPLGR